jgi:anti-repressor protein
MELIKIEERNGEQFVNARELHSNIESGRHFADWIKTRIEKYGFTEGIDFQKVSQINDTFGGSQMCIDYMLSVTMAKELAMVENNDKGREVRQYLIRLEQAWNTPDMVIARALQMSEKKIKSLQTQLADAQPKIEFFEAVTDSKDAIEMKDAAKVLNIGMGRNTLFEKLRDLKILMDNNTPYQTYIDRGYFRVVESKWITPQGETKISLKTVVYQKGLDFIFKAVTK